MALKSIFGCSCEDILRFLIKIRLCRGIFCDVWCKIDGEDKVESG